VTPTSDTCYGIGFVVLITTFSFKNLRALYSPSNQEPLQKFINALNFQWLIVKSQVPRSNSADSGNAHLLVYADKCEDPSKLEIKGSSFEPWLQTLQQFLHRKE